jgi:hypothetical protein
MAACPGLDGVHYEPAEEWGFMAVRVFISGLAAGLSCLTSIAVAEPPIGSRLGERVKVGSVEPEAVSARHGHEFASCLVNRRPQKVEALFAQHDGKGYETAYKGLMSGRLDCLGMWDDGNDVTEGRRFNIPAEVMRGFLAEELIKGDSARFSALPALPRQLTYSREWYGATSRHVAVDEMATCVTETAPVATLTLLQAEPYSAAEGTAFGSLGPSLGACLRAGTKVDANRQTLRAALADALYERVANPVVASAVK